MMTFSLRPAKWSILPSMAASVSTFVVSWNEAADRNESVASDAFVMPSSNGWPTGGSLPSAMSALAASSNSKRFTWRPGRKSDSPASMTATLRSIWRAMTSMCLSLMSTPWDTYTPWTWLTM